MKWNWSWFCMQSQEGFFFLVFQISLSTCKVCSVGETSRHCLLILVIKCLVVSNEIEDKWLKMKWQWIIILNLVTDLEWCGYNFNIYIFTKSFNKKTDFFFLGREGAMLEHLGMYGSLKNLLTFFKFQVQILFCELINKFSWKMVLVQKLLNLLNALISFFILFTLKYMYYVAIIILHHLKPIYIKISNFWTNKQIREFKWNKM